jgi:hypothetical protein
MVMIITNGHATRLLKNKLNLDMSKLKGPCHQLNFINSILLLEGFKQLLETY